MAINMNIKYVSWDYWQYIIQESVSSVWQLRYKNKVKITNNLTWFVHNWGSNLLYQIGIFWRKGTFTVCVYIKPVIYVYMKTLMISDPAPWLLQCCNSTQWWFWFWLLIKQDNNLGINKNRNWKCNENVQRLT